MTISQLPRGSTIPGVTGKKVPGTARLPKNTGLGGFQTKVPFIHSESPSGSSIFREYHRQQVRDASGRFAGGWGAAWIGLQHTDRDVYRFAEGKVEKLRATMESVKDEMVAYAQANAPWEDRTGLARDSIQGTVVQQSPTEFTIFLGHGAEVYYGIWLEVRWGGKFAILLPTLEAFRGRVEQQIRTQT